MDSIQNNNISNKNIKENQLIKNNKKLSNDFNPIRQDDRATQADRPVRNNSINSQNKNNTGNFKIINLKQKLQDQILFGNDRKHAHLVSNINQQRSRPKNNETPYLNSRTSKGKNKLKKEFLNFQK